MKMVILGLIFLLVFTMSFFVYRTLYPGGSFKGAEMVFVPGGTFLMGLSGIEGIDSGEDYSAYEKDIVGFYIDKYEVTNAQYRDFLIATDSESTQVDPVNMDGVYNWRDGEYPDGQANYPVALVSQAEAYKYCSWAGKRLPAEYEWEKSCRGERGVVWSYGNDFVLGYANTREVSLKRSSEVGFFENDRSPYGVYDMAGNVMEWTQSEYRPYEWEEIKKRIRKKVRVVVRGGGWMMKSDYSRCSSRLDELPNKRHRAIGFRCARDIR